MAKLATSSIRVKGIHMDFPDFMGVELSEQDSQTIANEIFFISMKVKLWYN